MYGKVLINKLKMGYYLYSFNNKEMYIHNINIYPKFQGKGLFKNLMNEIIHIAIINNCNRISLEPCLQDENCNFDTTEKLIKLYMKYGFTPDNDLLHYTLSINSIKTI